ncbi:MAG: AAA family ATPase [Candidatus Aenigmatarchaeota archaeon]|nr:AAA family ATPase [Candidatus Aenigmarchaeota archaeon]
MIKSIKLINWKSHEESFLEFSGGTNVLTGSIGAGKSSIMDAICFALFGTFPSIQSKKIKLDDVIMSKPKFTNDASVILNFDYDGKEYTIERYIERGKGTTSSEIREGDKLLEKPNSQRVTDIVQRILKIDYDLFSKAIYSEQNSIDYFLKLSKGERMKKIDNLLKIDKFEKARSSLVTLRNKLANKKITIEKYSIDEDEEKIEEKIKNSNEIIKENYVKIEKLNEERNKANLQYQKISEDIEKIENDIKKMEILKERINNMDNNIRENKRRMEKIRESLKGLSTHDILNEISKLKEAIKNLEIEKSAMEKNIEIMLVEKSKKNSEITFLSKKNDELDKKIKTIKDAEEKLKQIKIKYDNDPQIILNNEEKKLREFETSISILEFRLHDIEESSKKISEISGKCPVCDSDINEDKKKHLLHIRSEMKIEIQKEIQKLNNEKKSAENKILQIKLDIKEIEKIKSTIENVEPIIKEYQDNENIIKKYKDEIIKIETNIDSEKSKLEKKSNEIDIMKRNFVQLQNLSEKLNDLQELKKSNENMQVEMDNANKEYKNLFEKYKNIDFEKMKNEKISFAMKISEINVEIERSKERIENNEKLIDELKLKLEKIRKIKSEIINIQNSIKNLDLFELALERTQNQLRQDFIETVNIKMSEIWSEIYPYSDYIDIRLAVEDDDYTLQLSDSTGQWMDVDRVSGGERSIASLTLRIAFSLVLVPHLNWLILDEPTHNLDSKSIEKLNEVLRDRINEFVQQVFIITHEKSLESAASGEIYNIKRNKDKDEASAVERITEI